MSPQEAFEAARKLWPRCEAIRRSGSGAYLYFNKTDYIAARADCAIGWPVGVDRWPINIRPYTFHEIVQHVANGRDETNYGYIVGVTANCVTFKRNDIAETRTLSDCSDVTWADGSLFGVTP